jgi:hypothetical protein
MFFPPDPEDYTEMRLAIALLGAFARGGLWGIVFGILLLIAYVIARLILWIIAYLFQLYRERLSSPSPYARYFNYLLRGALAIPAISLVLSTQEATEDFSIPLLKLGMAVFCVASVILDWYVGSTEQAETPLLEGVTIDDVVAWQNQVNEAYEAGLMARK